GVAGTACVEAFYIHPELREFGGGGSGQSTSDETFGPDGVRHRAVDLRVRHEVDPGGVETRAIGANRPRSLVRLRVELELDADFADLTDVIGAAEAPHRLAVRARHDGAALELHTVRSPL